MNRGNSVSKKLRAILVLWGGQGVSALGSQPVQLSSSKSEANAQPLAA